MKKTHQTSQENAGAVTSYSFNAPNYHNCKEILQCQTSILSQNYILCLFAGVYKSIFEITHLLCIALLLSESVLQNCTAFLFFFFFFFLQYWVSELEYFFFHFGLISIIIRVDIKSKYFCQCNLRQIDT